MYFAGCSPSYHGPKGMFYAHLLSKFALLKLRNRNIWIDGGKNLFKEKIISYDQVLIDIQCLSKIIYFVQEVDILTLFSV